MGLAHLVGTSARRVGHSARDLDPALRRDGIGFSVLGLAVVVAAAEWWDLAGPVGRVVDAVVAGTLGRVALVLPLVLVAFGVRLLRHPQHSQANSRIGVGTAALTVSVTGLVHLSQHSPSPSDGAARMRGAGGMIGFLASSPLEAGVTGYGAILILLLVGGFGVLVVTATPVHAIPDRMLELRDRLFHRDSTDSADSAGSADGAGPGAGLPPNGLKAAAPAAAAPASVLSRLRRSRGGPAKDEAPALAGDEAFETPLEKAERERAGLRPGQRREAAPDIETPADADTGPALVLPAAREPLVAPPTQPIPHASSSWPWPAT